jgi:uncharacterized protein (TIGR02996 family)
MLAVIRGALANGDTAMNDREAILAAICGSPDDDHPRLVYADWLEENGVSDADRARSEFIRLQCAVDRLEEWSPERFDLEYRATVLIRSYGDLWRKEAPSWAHRAEIEHAIGSTFRKGFLHQISCNPDDLLLDRGKLFEAAPIREAELGFVRDGGIGLAGYPDLTRFHQLHLRLANTPLDFRSLGCSPYLSNLSDLKVTIVDPEEFSRNTRAVPALMDEDARQLARSPSLAGLEGLSLPYHQIGPDGVQALVESPNLMRFKRLDLSGNPIGRLGMERLARSPWCGQLTSLDVVSTCLTCGSCRLG